MLLLLSYTAYPAGMAALLAVAPYTPFAWSASTVSGLREQKIVSIVFSLKKTKDKKGALRGSRPVAGDLGITRRREGGVWSGEDEAQDDKERHDPDAEEDYGGAVVLAKETRDSHAEL